MHGYGFVMKPKHVLCTNQKARVSAIHFCKYFFNIKLIFKVVPKLPLECKATLLEVSLSYSAGANGSLYAKLSEAILKSNSIFISSNVSTSKSQVIFKLLVN